jgi:antitoxin component of MazEF toxin-antitoxin module
MTNIECTSIRKVGGSIYLRIPAAYAREHQLEIGDVVIWNPDGSFRILKRERFEKIANQAAEFVAAEVKAAELEAAE